VSNAHEGLLQQPCLHLLLAHCIAGGLGSFGHHWNVLNNCAEMRPLLLSFEMGNRLKPMYLACRNTIGRSRVRESMPTRVGLPSVPLNLYATADVPSGGVGEDPTVGDSLASRETREDWGNVKRSLMRFCPSFCSTEFRVSA